MKSTLKSLFILSILVFHISCQHTQDIPDIIYDGRYVRSLEKDLDDKPDDVNLIIKLARIYSLKGNSKKLNHKIKLLSAIAPFLEDELDDVIQSEQENPEFRKQMILLMADIKSEKAQSSIFSALKSENKDISRAAFKSLLNMKSAYKNINTNKQKPESPERLIGNLGESSKVIRGSAISSLSKTINKDAYLEKILPFIKDPHPYVRCNTAYFLSGIDDEKAIAGLITLLEDKNPLVQKAAILGLGKIKKIQAIESLKDITRKYPYEQRGILASLSLLQLGEYSGVSLLTHLDEDLIKDDYVTHLAIYLIGENQIKEGVTFITRNLDHENPEIVMASITALRKIRDPKVVKKLKKLTKDSSEVIKLLAVEAIDRISQ